MTADIAFLIDGSTIWYDGQQNFNRILDFVKALAKSFVVSESRSHISVTVYTDNPRIHFTLTQHYDISTIETAINSITYTGGSANTGKALSSVKTSVFDATGRANVPRVLILLAHAVSLDGVSSASQALRSAGVTIFSVGIGNYIKIFQLNTIASDPDVDHVFTASFSELHSLEGSVRKRICLGK
ncbi:predicted protein [Nematostella vectensis]|uniref:VWFA domain-containing protein n=1 Tax=Nematostella vectensis TaxID=45351 RepID=A7S6N4_NEMVE|nr:predicted protein [Nematostella vectensis]|eukprot:XP_001632749.1 predicted protein [Nematostella vectensis]